jgi:hypothetical protein
VVERKGDDGEIACAVCSMPNIGDIKMNKKTLDQINGYSRLIVRELHDVVMDELIFDKLKTVLSLSEELEMYLLSVRQQNQVQSDGTNILQFRRFA